MLIEFPDSEYQAGLVLVHPDVAVAEHERLAHELAQVEEAFIGAGLL